LSVTLMQGQRLRMFMGGVLREVCGSERDGPGIEVHCTHRTTSLATCTTHQILLGWSNRCGWDKQGEWHIRGRRKMHTGFWCGNLKERGHVEDLAIDGRIVINWSSRNRMEVLIQAHVVKVQLSGCCKQGNEHSGSIK